MSMEFLKQEQRSGLPFPPSEDLPDPGIEPASPESHLLHCQVGSLPLSHLGSLNAYRADVKKFGINLIFVSLRVILSFPLAVFEF